MTETTATDTAPAEGTSDAAPETTILGGPSPTESTDTTAAPAEGAEGAKPADTGAPEKYELKLPGESLFDAAALEGIGTFARDLGLSAEAAQKLVERDSRMLDQFADHIDKIVQAEHKERVADWAKNSREDKELGGDKFSETTFLADKAMRMFASPELKKALNETGFGNHPELLRLFVKIGRTVTEDTFNATGADNSGAPADIAKTMFPTMN